MFDDMATLTRKQMETKVDSIRRQVKRVRDLEVKLFKIRKEVLKGANVEIIGFDFPNPYIEDEIYVEGLRFKVHQNEEGSASAAKAITSQPTEVKEQIAKMEQSIAEKNEQILSYRTELTTLKDTLQEIENDAEANKSASSQPLEGDLLSVNLDLIQNKRITDLESQLLPQLENHASIVQEL
jgi:hypothetical protein